MEISKKNLILSHHRSKKRIRDLGEVFTPEEYVNEMLDILDEKIWSDNNVVFFESAGCGHGNFVIAIVQKRLKSFLKQGKRAGIQSPHFYSVANTLNNLWAIDIDSKNISLCRGRVWDIVFNFLIDNEKEKIDPSRFIYKNKGFFAHIFCCIKWHIHKNEALSCLEEDSIKAKNLSNKISTSEAWIKGNKHNPVNFKMPWSEYYRKMERDNSTPLEYIKAMRFLRSFKNKSQKINTKSFNFVKLDFL